MRNRPFFRSAEANEDLPARSAIFLVSFWCKTSPWAVPGAGFAAEDGGLSQFRTKI